MRYSIYTITCKDPFILDSYVGRTTMNPKQRFSNHKSLSLKSDRRLYKTINQYGGIDNWEFTIIEEGLILDYDVSKEREEYYCNKLKPTLNINIPNRSIKQWRIDKREYYNNYMKNYMKAKRRKPTAVKF